MVFIAAILILALITFLNIRYGIKCRDNMGHGIGDKYMKDHWGMEEKDEYHE